jgi:serine/threonine protein kinase
MAALSLLTGLFGGKKRVTISKRFDLVSTAGPGSTSKVWKARDHKLGQMVCLKITEAKKEPAKAKKASTDGKKASQPPAPKAPSEGKVLEALTHPHIVRALEHGLTSKEEQYVVMEFIEGVGLHFLIETKNSQLAGNRVNFLTQLTEAVEYIHGQKFLHRDIRPRNVLVTKDNVVKLIDFELAIPNDPAFCRPGGSVVGNANYLAPELIKRRPMDHRSDLFSLGVTAYEVFTANLPWEKADSWQTALAHINRPGLPPRDFRADLDERTSAFLIKAIARDPQERFQTAAQFRTALAALPRKE